MLILLMNIFYQFHFLSGLYSEFALIPYKYSVQSFHVGQGWATGGPRAVYGPSVFSWITLGWSILKTFEK